MPHEVGNPLAVITGLAQQMPEGDAEARASRQILAQTERIVGRVRKISGFAGARSEAAEWVEINPMLQTVCEFQAFDRRFRRADS